MTVLRFVRFWREILILTLAAAVVLLWHQRPAPATETIEVMEKTKVEKRDTITHKEIRKLETKPDGTKVFTVEKDTSDAKVSENSTEEKVRDLVVPAARPSPKYSLGIYTPAFSTPEVKNLQIDFGYQIGASPVEGVVGYSLKDHETTLGLRVHF